MENQCSPPSSFWAQFGEEDKAPVLETFRKLFEALFIFDVRLRESRYMNGVTVQKTAYLDMSVFRKIGTDGDLGGQPVGVECSYLIVCADAETTGSWLSPIGRPAAGG